MMRLLPVSLTLDPLLFCLLCIVAVLLYNYFKNVYSAFEKLKIPGPTPKWIFGNLAEFRDKNPLDVFKEWRKKYGNIYGFYEGFRPSIVLSDPEMAKNILVKHFDKFHVRPLCNPFVYYPDDFSLLNTYGETWKKHRSIVASSFKSASVKHMVKCFSRTADKLMTKLEQVAEKFPNGFDISSLIDQFSLDAFASAAFNYDVRSLDNSDAVLLKYMRACNRSSAADNPICGLARVYEGLTPFLKLFDKEHKKIHELHVAELKKCIVEQRAKLEAGEFDVSEQNLMHHMMLRNVLEKGPDGKFYKRGLTNEEILGHLNSLIGGGVGTVNALIAFVLHHLSVNQFAQQKVYQEILDVIGESDEFDDMHLKDLVYLEWVISESLRLLPCAPGVARTCTEDCEINGVQFRKGWFIRIMLCTLYSDDTMFPKSHVFEPERFSSVEKEKRHPYTFLPFGQGPRICPGYGMGITQAKAVIVKILKKYVVQPCQQTVDPLPTALRPMLCPKDGVFVQLRERM